LPRVSRHEVHISGISNETKDEELSKLVALEDADAVLALNGTTFHGQKLLVQRRVFQKATESEAEGLSRKEKRKLAATKKEQAEVESKDEKGARSTADVVTGEASTRNQSKDEKVSQEEVETSSSSTFKIPS
ncbi:hypothetical protein BGZ65_000085, partial [Modicella reniformis]